MLKYLDFSTMIINILATFLIARGNIIGWPVGLVGLLMSAVLFFKVSLFADTLLQIILIGTFFYGWISWSSDKDNIVPLWLTQTQRIIYLIAWLVGSFSVYYLLKYNTPSTTPLWDAITSVGSLLAVYLAAQEKMDNWLLWLVIDSAYVVLYFYKAIPFAAITTIMYLALACYGLYEWQKLR